MKILKLLVFVSLVSLLPASVHAGLLDRVLPLVFRNRGNLFQPGLNGVQGQLFRNNALYTQFVQYYGTQNGGGNNDYPVNLEDDDQLVPGVQPNFGNQDNVRQVHDPYCPNQAGWPKQVARGELPGPHPQIGGSVFSDMLRDRYFNNEKDSEDDDVVIALGSDGIYVQDGRPEGGNGNVQGNNEVKLEEEEEFDNPGGTNEIVFERVEDRWVGEYLEGRSIVDGVPPGIMGEQVLDVARSNHYNDIEDEDQEDVSEVESNNEAVSERLLQMLRERGWTEEDAPRIQNVAEQYADFLTGYVDIERIREDQRLLATFIDLHEEFITKYRRDPFDILDYVQEIEELFDALGKLKKE